MPILYSSDVQIDNALPPMQVRMATQAILLLALGALLCAGHGAAAARTLQQSPSPAPGPTSDYQSIVDALNTVASDPPTAAALISTCACPPRHVQCS